jgi:Putative porin
MNNRWTRALCLLLLPFVAAAPTLADELTELRSLRDTTINLLNLLVQQGVLTREKADELIRQAQQAGAASQGAVAGQPGAAASQPGAVAGQPAVVAGQPGAAATTAPNVPAGSPAMEPGVIRVPYVPESVRQEIRAEVKQDVLAQARAERWGDPGALPHWLDRISFAGDVRFRGQADRFPTDNAPNAPPQLLQLPGFGAYNINNTSDPRNRLRLRARLGAEAKLGNTVTAGVRLTTGSAGTGGDPSSENENLGNYNARGTVGFDRAYISYKPLSWLYFTGGRLGNPFFSPTTMVWADDVSLQGAVLGLTPHFGAFNPFATAGVFPIQEIEPNPLNSARSKWLFGYQAGLKWQFLPSYSLKFSGALYDYRRMEGIPNPTLVTTEFNSTAAPFRQKGNSVIDINVLANTVNGTSSYLIGLASKFREASASASLDIAAFGTKHVVLDADYVKNLGYDHAEILARTGLDLPERTKGMQEKLTFGDTSFDVKHSWQAYIGYRRVESDAVLDAFTDSDFHLGGTDTTGYYMGARYAFETNSTIGFRWYSAKQIDGPPLAIDVLQLDLIAAF